MNPYILLLLAVLVLFSTALSAVSTVKSVDLQKYLGRWYQFAYFPNNFQPKDCVSSPDIG